MRSVVMEKHFTWTGVCPNPRCTDPQRFVIPGLVSGARAVIRCDCCRTTYRLTIVENTLNAVLEQLEEFPPLFSSK